MNFRLSALLDRLDRHAAVVLADALVLDLARHEREERVIAAEPDARARRDPGAALADENGAGIHPLAAKHFHAEHLRVRVATVARRAAAFLVCHLLRFLLGT